MSDETTLLPCPFCGGKAHTRMTGSGEYRLFSVDCRNIDCPCYMGGNVFHTKIEAIAAWNTRATLGSGECVIAPIVSGSDMGRCSACGHIADVSSNYCWKCGAKAVK